MGEHCDSRLKQVGFKPLQGWECLYHHEKHRAFLSVYVDDSKLAAPQDKLATIWQEVAAPGLKLHPPSEFHNSVYLGCCQYEYEVAEKEIMLHTDFYDQTLVTKLSSSKLLKTDLTEDCSEILAVRSAKRKAKKKIVDKENITHIPVDSLLSKTAVKEELLSFASPSVNDTKIDTSVQGWY